MDGLPFYGAINLINVCHLAIYGTINTLILPEMQTCAKGLRILDA